jgi:hypothetical protein
MLHSMKRGLFVGTVVVVVTALCSGPALAARGHGKLGPRGGPQGPFAIFGGQGGPGFGARGFGGPGFFGPGLRGPGMPGPMMGGPGMRHGGPGKGGPGGGALLGGAVLKTAAAYLEIPLATLQADLKAGKTLAQEAVAKGKTADGLIAALTKDAKENLDAAVAAGWLTQKQADAVLEQTTKAITNLVKNGPPVPPAKGETRAGPLETAATYLDMKVADLLTALKGGKTLAQVTVDKGKTVDGLVTALTAGAKAKLDKAVANDDITQAQANAILSKLTQQVTNFVNGVHPGKDATKTTTTNATKRAFAFTVRF